MRKRVRTANTPHPPLHGLQDPGGTVVRGDNEALFAIAMERLVTVCGKKWTKRALGMSAPAQQLEFVWRTARYVAARRSTPSGTAAGLGAVVAAEETEAAGELGALLDLRERILEELPAEQRGHFSISPEDINALAAAAATVHATPAAAAPISAISLESVSALVQHLHCPCLCWQPMYCVV